MISVVIPTIDSRQAHLEACLQAYHDTEPAAEIIVIHDKPVCGAAWVEGAGQATGDFLHFSADDLKPHAGWAAAAIEVCSRGFLPAPRILNDDSSLQSCGGSDGWETEHPTGYQTDFSRIPFMAMETWLAIKDRVVPFLRDAHYFTDNAVSFAAAKLGTRTGVHRDYAFVHSLAEAGRGAGMTWEQRMWADRAKYEQWARSL